MNPGVQRTLAPPRQVGVETRAGLPFRSLFRTCGRRVAAPFASNGVLLLVLVPYLAAAVLVERMTGLPVTVHVRSWQWLAAIETAAGLWLFAAMLAMSGFGLSRLWALERARRQGTTAVALGAAWRPFGRLLDAAARLMVCFIALNLFFKIFLGLKAAIPLVYPFAWDAAFIQLDRVTHLGYHPWRLLQPLFGYPVATRALDLLYYLWFPFNFAMLLWYGAQDDGAERRRFFVAYLAMWVLLGTVAAFAFSSAGPCFLGLVTGESAEYAPLMAYLRQVHAEHGLFAIAIQDALVERYQSEGFHPLEGISAMPSLHVAAAVLFALAIRSRSRGLAILFGVYAAVIMIGSVTLGWHYAVDGYASAAAVAGIWCAAGKVSGRKRP
jgi:membrane-associated phospholipid phosphatase